MPSAATPQFDNETKPPDRERPFHRIHYKDFDASGNKAKPDGIGVSCGCTNKEDFPDIDKIFDPEHIVDEELSNELLKSLFGSVTQVLNLIAKIPVIGAPAKLILSAVQDAFNSIAEKVIPKSFRAVPLWEPVKKGSRNDLVDSSQVVEVEGFVTRCYQNASDVPFFQWHRWFNWSVHIRPEHGYDWVAADTPNPPSTKDIDDPHPEDDDNMAADEHPITQNHSIECQWDPGALFANQSMFEQGIALDINNNSFDQQAQHACGPMFDADWAWPMTGQYAWASGRWVYDCGKSTKAEEKQKPKNCTMLNPCKAIATARWEAFKFPENDGAVPAIQFMFFACKRGGYIDHETLGDADYEFIVDLPDIDIERAAPFPIGHTAKLPDTIPPRFPHNTIVLRPRLLKFFNTGAFSATGAGNDPPVVEVIPPDDPQKAPRQVKITIPISKMTGAAAYGVIVSLGWHDPLNQQAEKVKLCTLNLSRLIDRQITRNDRVKDLKAIQDAVISAISGEIADQIPLLPDPAKAVLKKIIENMLDALAGLGDAAISGLAAESEIWLIRIGVNGRWFAFYREANINKEVPVNVSAQARIFLGEHDRLSISVSGAEIDRIGRLMFRARKDRELTVKSRVIPWKEIADSNKDFRQKLLVAYVVQMLLSFGEENEPLGFIDAQIDPGLSITDRQYPEGNDPISIDDQTHPFGVNVKKLGTPPVLPALNLKAKEAKIIGGPQCVYVEGDDADYVLDCDLTIDPQKLPDS